LLLSRRSEKDSELSTQSDEFQDALIFAALALDFEVPVGILRSRGVAQSGREAV